MKAWSCAPGYSPAACDAARLLEVLGPKGLAALQKAFGGRRLWIPKEGWRIPCLACRKRDECVREWKRRGRPAADIAGRLGLSVKSVYRILKEAA